MSANELTGQNQVRFVQATFSRHEAAVFDHLCEQTGLTASAAGAVILSFVCRSITGTRDAKPGDLETLLADEFGDLRMLMSRVKAVTDKGEGVIENGRSLVAMLTAEVGSALPSEEGNS